MLVSGFVLFFLDLQENNTIAHYGLDVYFRSNKTIMIKTIRGSGHSPICEQCLSLHVKWTGGRGSQCELWTRTAREGLGEPR